MSIARPSIVKNLYKLEMYRRKATPEKSAFILLAEELMVDVQSVRNAASKYGFVGFRGPFTARQEEMLVCSCQVFARHFMTIFFCGTRLRLLQIMERSHHQYGA